ncbi:hypothetical protein PHMEG_0003507 [Phytophthora megakarya]|uniref:Uncharacterized protein n=1 Tax=Phytophthora megakarya TaxID=4795 RepID=A0A225WXW7_9STRA|nr:hypothetical protein PHMEG_0003507 [Phytophthora megakarya]
METHQHSPVQSGSPTAFANRAVVRAVIQWATVQSGLAQCTAVAASDINYIESDPKDSEIAEDSDDENWIGGETASRLTKKKSCPLEKAHGAS